MSELLQPLMSDWFQMVYDLNIFSRVLRDFTPRFFGPSVGRSPFYFFYVFAVFGFTALAQMLLLLKSCPCPPARD